MRLESLRVNPPNEQGVEFSAGRIPEEHAHPDEHAAKPEGGEWGAEPVFDLVQPKLDDASQTEHTEKHRHTEKANMYFAGPGQNAGPWVMPVRLADRSHTVRVEQNCRAHTHDAGNDEFPEHVAHGSERTDRLGDAQQARDPDLGDSHAIAPGHDCDVLHVQEHEVRSLDQPTARWNAASRNIFALQPAHEQVDSDHRDQTTHSQTPDQDTRFRFHLDPPWFKPDFVLAKNYCRVNT